MAVINDYVDANLAAGKINAQQCVKETFTIPVTFEVAAADEDASIYRLLKNVNPDLILLQARVACDALTGATDWDLGFYEPLEAGGAVVDKDLLGDGLNLSAGYSRILALDGMVTMDIANAKQRIYEMAGHTISNRKAGYDICLTANTVGSGAGTVTVYFTFAQGY